MARTQVRLIELSNTDEVRFALIGTAQEQLKAKAASGVEIINGEVVVVANKYGGKTDNGAYTRFQNYQLYDPIPEYVWPQGSTSIGNCYLSSYHFSNGDTLTPAENKLNVRYPIAIYGVSPVDGVSPNVAIFRKWEGNLHDMTVTLYYPTDPEYIASASTLPYEIVTPQSITVALPIITFDKNGNTSITCETSGTTIYYTLDGSTPTTGSTQYSSTFQVSENTTVKAYAVLNIEPNTHSSVATNVFVRQYITFENDTVEAICMANYSTDGIGVKFSDVSGVTSLTTDFNSHSQYNTSLITSFNELKYFTSLSAITQQTGFDGCPNLASITLPDSLRTIGQNAFYMTGALEELVIPNSVTTIERGAFHQSGLKALNIPASVTSIGGYLGLFNQLETITVASGNTVYNDGNGSNCLIRTADNTLINGCKNSTIPNTVVTIGDSSFPSLSYNLSATTINIPSSVTTIGNFAFSPSGLKTLTIPSSVTSIGGNILSDDARHSTEYVIMESTTPCTISQYAWGLNETYPIYVPDEQVDTYKAATNWILYKDRIFGVSKLTEKPEKPIIVPSGGTYSETVKVTIHAEDGSTIYYTTDGSTPTTGSTQYDGTVLFVTNTTTIKAIAYDPTYVNSVSDTAIETYTISHPARSRKAPRQHDNNNGIYVKNVTYSGIPTNLRSAYILPSAITVTDTEADITWGYHIDNVEEDLGDYGTKCHVTDTSITIYIPFTHGGKQYTLTKEIPCTCIVQDAVDTTDQIDIIEAYAICTLENKFRVNVKARVKHTTEETVGIITDLTNYTLSGSSTNGNFICNKDGAYFLYDDILTLDYSGSVHPANEVLLTLVNNNTNSELDHYTITVTFETGSIFDVRDDAIRMAVQTSHEEISGVTNHLTQLELNVSGITGTVSALTNSVSGISADVSQLQQTASSITATVYNLSGEMVTHSEIVQISTAITMNVFNEIGEKTGIDISGGTITLDASKTIVTGELEINDGMAFYDQYGNPAVSIGGDELGVYADQTNGSINYRYLYVTEYNATGYSFTTDKDSLGQYNSGDTITYQYLAIWDTITPDSSTQSQWDESTAVTCQIQLYLDNNSEPFATYTATLTGATNTPMKSLRANPIREFTLPSGGTVYAKYAITSQSTSQIGTRYAQVSAQVGSKQANTVNIRKGGINIGHAANYMTYLGADDTVLRKGTTGFKYGKRNDANGIPQIAVSTYALLGEGATFSEHPDNIMPDARVYWTPTANFTWHTSSFSACDTYYGQVQGYTSYGDRYNARIREDKLCGDLWLDMLSYEAQDLRGERIFVLLPPTTRQVVVDNKVAIHSLPEGYTVKILNMNFYNGVYIAPNLMDGYSVSPANFYKPDGTKEDILYFNAMDTYIELVYGGTYTTADEGMRQLWYVRNWNNL